MLVIFGHVAATPLMVIPFPFQDHDDYEIVMIEMCSAKCNR